MGVYLENYDEAVKFARALRSGKTRKLIFTNGCFDLLHRSHVWALDRAKDTGRLDPDDPNLNGFLLVGVNADAVVGKGPGRPIIPQEDRVEMLLHLNCVDAVCLFHEPTPIELIKAVRPDILVKGADYADKRPIVGEELVLPAGGQVVLTSFYQGPLSSTTQIVEKIQAPWKDELLRQQAHESLMREVVIVFRNQSWPGEVGTFIPYVKTALMMKETLVLNEYSPVLPWLKKRFPPEHLLWHYVKEKKDGYDGNFNAKK